MSAAELQRLSNMGNGQDDHINSPQGITKSGAPFFFVFEYFHREVLGTLWSPYQPKKTRPSQRAGS